MGSKKRNPLFKSPSPSYDGKGKHTRGGDFGTARERRGAYGIGAAGSGFAGVRHRGLFRGGARRAFLCHRDLRPVRRERGKIEGAGGHALAVPPVAHPPGAGEAPGEGREVIPAGGVRAGCQCSLETRRREFCEGRRQTAGFGAAAAQHPECGRPPWGKTENLFWLCRRRGEDLRHAGGRPPCQGGGG